MPVKHLQVPRYMSFLNNFDLNWGKQGGTAEGIRPFIFHKGAFFMHFCARIHTCLQTTSTVKIRLVKERSV